MIGFYKPDFGSILFEGKEIDFKRVRRIFGFATQDNCFYGRLSVQENMRYFGRMYGVSGKRIKENIGRLIDLVELKESRKVLAQNLSGGMQRRLDLACALMHDPEILILDEPTQGLDPTLRRHMWRLIKKIHDQGTTIIVSSHLLSEIEPVCNKVSILYQGEIVVVDSPQKLKDLYSKNEEIILESFPGDYDKIIGDLEAHNLKVVHIAKRDNQLVMYSPKAATVLRQILHFIEKHDEKLLDVSVNKPSLDEVFEALTKKKRVNQKDYDALKKYVEKCLMKNIPPKKVEQVLLLNQWPKEMIDHAIEEVMG